MWYSIGVRDRDILYIISFQKEAGNVKTRNINARGRAQNPAFLVEKIDFLSDIY